MLRPYLTLLSDPIVLTRPLQVGFWHGARVSAFRKSAGIVYPQAYADKSDMSAATPEQKKKMYLFNCAQRAHG
jgi:glutathione S-transferase